MKKRFLSFIMMIIMIVTLIPFSGSADEQALDASKKITLDRNSLPQALSYIDVEKIDHALRLYDQETDLSTAKFLNNDGTVTVYYFNEPIKYIDGNGEIKDKNVSLSESTDSFKMTQNDVLVTLPKSLKSGVTANIDGYNINLVPITETGKISGEINKRQIILSDRLFTDKLIAAEKSDLSVSYNKVFDDSTKLEYIPQMSGFKENIILEKYSGKNEFSFILNTDGLFLVSDDYGNYSLLDDKDEEIAVLGKVVSFDSGNKVSYGEIVSTTVVEGSQYIIKICVDKDFLTSEGTVYPVTVDPVITKTTYEFEYICLQSSNPTGGNLGAYVSMFTIAEYFPMNYMDRLVIRFPGLISDGDFNNPANTIANASLNTFYTQNQILSAYTWTGPVWSTTTTTFNNCGMAFYSGSKVSSSFSGQSLSMYPLWCFNLTTITQKWKTGTDSNYNISKGLIIITPNTDGYSANIYNSYLTAIGAGPLSLSITYNMPDAPLEVTSVLIGYQSGKNSNMSPGQTQTLTRTVLPSGSNQSLTWKSSNPAVASVNSSGVVTANKVGYAIIRATSTSNPSKYGELSIKVNTLIGSLDGCVFFIKNAASGLYLDIPGGTHTEGTQIETYAKQNNRQQRWKFVSAGSNKYTIIPLSDKTMVLDVYNAYSTSGTKVTQYHSNNSNAQKWNVVANSDGTYRIYADCATNNALTAAGSSNKSLVSSDTYNSTNSYQKWYLEDVSTQALTISFYYDAGFSSRHGSGATAKLNALSNGTITPFTYLFNTNLNRSTTQTSFASIMDTCTGKTIYQKCVGKHTCGSTSSHSGFSQCTNQNHFRNEIYLNNNLNPSLNNVYYFFTRHQTYKSSDGSTFNNNYASYGTRQIFMQGQYADNDYYLRHTVHELAHIYGTIDHYCNLLVVNNVTFCKNGRYCSNTSHKTDENGNTLPDYALARKRTSESSKSCLMHNMNGVYSSDGSYQGKDRGYFIKNGLSEWTNIWELFCDMCREDIANFMGGN